MKLESGLHLAYCANIHRGESWPENFAALEEHALAVRRRVCPDAPYALGLRLSARAARDLAEPATLASFRGWLEANACYVFTINGFPYGEFHAGRVKEGVYHPDWTTPERLEYTCRLIDVLAALLPEGIEGSISTLPGAFKESLRSPRDLELIRAQLGRAAAHAAATCARTGRRVRLGLEPEPLCLLETSAEVVRFFGELRADSRVEPAALDFLGITYDTCHFGVGFEQAGEALARLRAHQVPLVKIQLSSALRVRPTPEALEALAAFADDTYLHQVVARDADGGLRRFRDLPDALAAGASARPGEEWRIHFHVPLHQPATPLLGHTADHLLGVLDALAADPALCSHLEMETYTWGVLPPALRSRHVVEQLAAEHAWTLEALARRGLRQAQA